MLNLNKNKLIPATEISTSWGEIKGDISKQTDLVKLTTDLDTSIKGWVESQNYLTEHQDLSDYALKTEIPSLYGYATEEWVTSQGYLTEHQDLSSYALKTEIPDVSGYVQETNLKTINGESLVGNGDIVIQTTAENIECGPVSTDLFNFSNVNEGLIQIVDSVEEINNTKENKKPVFYIDVDFDGPSVRTSYADYMSIGAQIKQLGADNVVLYVRDMSGYICIPDVIEAVSQNFMTITGMAYANNYRIYNDSSSLFISFNSFVGYTQLENKINDVKTWVVNQKYVKKTELKTINGQSIVGSGDITIQATGGITEEWLQTNLKTIDGQSLIGGGDLAVHNPIEISIDIDSGQLSITYDEYKAMIDEYANDGGYTKKLMIFLESETAGRGYSSYPSDVEYCPDGTIEIGGYFLDDRDENDKKLVYYRIKGNDAAQKVEISFTPVPSGDMPSLTGYATQEWVISQGYITSIPDTYATKTWVSEQGYLTSHQDLSSYALKSEIPSLTGYATQTWVTSQGYTTQTYVDNKIGQIDTLLDQMLG